MPKEMPPERLSEVFDKMHSIYKSLQDEAPRSKAYQNAWLNEPRVRRLRNAQARMLRIVTKRELVEFKF